MIVIEVKRTKRQANGKALGTWNMQWGHQHWYGTWKADEDGGVEWIKGDPVVETPIDEDALRDLIYCAHDDY